MASDIKIKELLTELSRTYSTLSIEEQVELAAILASIVNIIELNNNSILHGFDKLASIASHAKRFSKGYDEENSLSRKKDSLSLRTLRNQFVHGHIGIRSPSELRRFSSLLWRVLEKSADKLNPVNLFNLLSYCIGTLQTELDPQIAGSLRIIKLFRAIYNALNEDKQRQTFTELLIRLYSDMDFRYILEEAEEREKYR